MFTIKWLHLRVGNSIKKNKLKFYGSIICTQDLTGVAISINKWWKTRYPEFKMRVVSKKEFEQIKMQELSF